MARGLEYAEQQRRPAPDVERRTSGAPVARRLLVGRADDPAEREADDFAAGLIADLHRRPITVRRAAHSSSADPLGGTAVDAGVQTRISAARRGGAALPAPMRSAVEARTGADLGAVRVHSSREAGDLSRSLQATAFTVGHDVFLGDDAPRPGSPAGDEVLAHELGHVVQSTGITVRRLFPSKKPKPGSQVTGSSGNAETAGGLSKADKAERAAGHTGGRKQLEKIQREIGLLESALAKILALPEPMSDEDLNVAMELAGKAEKMLDILPGGPKGRARQLLGVELPDERGRLRRVAGEIELKTNRTRIAKSKAQAEQVYLDAGRDAATAGAPAGKHGFQKLSAKARDIGFGNAQAAPADARAAARVKKAGAKLNLTAAETAAILTFTAPDYLYINPATANDDEWMTSAQRAELGLDPSTTPLTKKKAKARQKKLTTLKEEGALHAGMAMKGLAKLPPWIGPVYRGEAVNQQEFNGFFTNTAPPGSEPKFVANKATRERLAIASQSKAQTGAEYFMEKLARPELKGPARYQVLFITQLIDGRDIEDLSTNPLEKEVATLPGAVFRIDSIEVDGTVPGAGHLIVHCTQTH